MTTQILQTQIIKKEHICGHCFQKLNLDEENVRQTQMFENKAVGLLVYLHKKCKPVFIKQMRISNCEDCGKIYARSDNKKICYDCENNRIKKNIKPISIKPFW
jgi:hypothetical protein